MKKIKETFNALPPDKKRKVVIVICIVALLIFFYFGYQSKVANKPKTVRQEPVKQNIIDFTKKDEDLAMRLSFNQQMKELQDNNTEIAQSQQEKIEDLKRQLEAITTRGYGADNASMANRKNNDIPAYGDLALNGTPPPPTYPYGNGQDIPTYRDTKEKEKPKPIILTGNIAIISIRIDEPKKDNATKTKLTGKRLINFIPAGTILKATLLNGMYAPTMGKGKNRPYPALFRLVDLSFLPNGFRKDLSGCFMTGEASGELSDSRVHIRTSKLSCISNDEKRVLEKDIKGFVNGDDGKVGIFGEIRANFGKVALSAFLAEFLAAAGDVVKSSTQIVTQNPLGGITTAYKPKVEDMLLSAAGSGFGESAKMIAEFYLEIMKEMSPVIEVSGRRNVEIIIDQGIELYMDDFDWQGVKQDEKIDFDSILNRI